MALARIRRGESGMNYWPGFVDALSTLILSIIFLLTIFVVVQFYLQQEVRARTPHYSTSAGKLPCSLSCYPWKRPAKSTWKINSATYDHRLRQHRAIAINIKVYMRAQPLPKSRPKAS